MKQQQLPKTARRGDRLIRERVHDPYKTRLKLPEPSVCPDCGAAFHKGRWTWTPAPEGAKAVRCQACHRIADNYPAGIVTLRGGFLDRHRAEILNLARNQETLEKGEHPLHRIMAVAERSDEVEIATTDIHLPRRIGQALHDAYEGALEIDYDKEGYFVRVAWTRET
ncbi:MAG: BCAM0308 family protein [Alphaproteobacteria bacterium]